MIGMFLCRVLMMRMEVSIEIFFSIGKGAERGLWAGKLEDISRDSFHGLPI